MACEVSIKDGLVLKKTEDDGIVGYDDNVGEGFSHLNETTLPNTVQQWYGIVDSDPDLFVPKKHRSYLSDLPKGSIYREFIPEDHPNMRNDTDRRTSCARSASYLNDGYSSITFAIIADCFEYTYLPADYAERYPDEGPHEFYTTDPNS